MVPDLIPINIKCQDGIKKKLSACYCQSLDLYNAVRGSKVPPIMYKIANGLKLRIFGPGEHNDLLISFRAQFYSFHYTTRYFIAVHLCIAILPVN